MINYISTYNQVFCGTVQNNSIFLYIALILQTDSCYAVSVATVSSGNCMSDCNNDKI